MYDIIGFDDEQLKGAGIDLGLTLSEMQSLREYFIHFGRNPEEIEIQAVAQAWSEHSCYKSSKIYLKKYFSDLKSDYTILTMEDDAAVVSINEDYAYVVKMESHNHPSAVEPYGGAATGVGGIIRDVLCMGAQPAVLIDSLYFGNPENSSGILTERFIMNRVIAGIRDYGNRVGIPTIAGSVDFDESYNTIPLVNAGCIGIVKKDKIVRSFVNKVGDLLIVCGGRTGRDGIHGVNFASKILDKSNEENKNAVQLGNPIIKEPLIHAVLEINDMGIIDGMKDLGGGGFSSAVSEILYAGGVSAEIDLDRVLLKDKNMKSWEIWVSESQERMLLALSEQNLKKAEDIFNKWGIEFSVIGKTVSNENLVIKYKNKKIMDMNLAFLTSGPIYKRDFKPKKQTKVETVVREPENYRDFIHEFIQRPNICSRFNIVRQYDFTVRGNTINRPFIGFPNHETHSDASVFKAIENSPIGISVTSGSREKSVDIDPYEGTIEVLMEAYKNTICTGSIPNGVVDAMNFGNPEVPETMYNFIESVHAISDFCKKMNLPLVSGNVSFYNETEMREIKPTPNILMIGTIDDVRKIKTPEFKRENDPVYLVGELIDSLAGSEYAEVFKSKFSSLTKADYELLKEIMGKIHDGYNAIMSMHDISQGGLLMSILEMSFGNDLGIDADVSSLEGNTSTKLFSELGTAMLIEVDSNMEEHFLKIFNGIPLIKIGKTLKNNIIIKDMGKTIISENKEILRNLWEHGLDKYI